MDAARQCDTCRGSGICRACFGNGGNFDLSSDSPSCQACHGTGKCVECEGYGHDDRRPFVALESVPSITGSQLSFSTVPTMRNRTSRWLLISLSLPFALWFVFGAITKVSYSRNHDAVERATEVFHRRFMAGRSDEIYAAGSDRFRLSMTSAEHQSRVVKLVERVGPCKFGGPYNVSYSFGISSTEVLESYVATCERGRYEETLTWIIGWDGRPILERYDILNPQL